MTDREPANEIEDAAVDWLAKAERGLSEDEQSALDQWLDSDARHLGAYVRAQAAWIHAERATALGAMPEAEAEAEVEPTTEGGESIQAKPAMFNRRKLIVAGSAMAASIAAIGVFGFDRSRTLESGVGEIRRLSLADGTALILDTDTKVEVAEGSSDRKLGLVRGKLFVDVIRHVSLPLIVQAGGLMMEMAEGSFGVQSLEDTPLVALVTKGVLAVSQDGGFFQTRRAVTVETNNALTLTAGANLLAEDVQPIAATQRDAILAWRDGMLSFGGETLATAVRAFDRYGPTRIVVADTELAHQKITGLFKADDPKGFAVAVAASFGAFVTPQGNNLRISRKNLPGA